MYLSSIKIKNFRGYQKLLLDFSCGINFFVGKNGSGKTNLLEAIQYLSFAKSFKGVNDDELIKFGENSAFISGLIKKPNKSDEINILIDKNEKKVLLNGKNLKKLSSLNEISNVIIFSPKDVNIFIDSPNYRRMFLDLNISKLNLNYCNYLKIANNLLKQRNELLKNEIINEDELDVITEQLIDVEKDVVLNRISFIDKINTLISKIFYQLTEKNIEIKINYSPFIKIDENYKENAKKLYKSYLEMDKKRKFTNVGIHHEDFTLLFNGKDIADVGSQGENRLSAISLKLAPYFLVENKENHPIIVLDDVMSELDNFHQEKLINFLRKFEQVFISGTNIKFSKVNIFEITNHEVKRRNV